VRTTQRDSQGTRTVAGRVNSDGTVAGGTSDFTCTRTGVGAYTVRWTFPVRAILGTTVTAGTAGANYAAVSGHPDGTGGFFVQIYNSAVAASDLAFEFIAVVMPR